MVQLPLTLLQLLQILGQPFQLSADAHCGMAASVETRVGSQTLLDPACLCPYYENQSNLWPSPGPAPQLAKASQPSLNGYKRGRINR